MDDRVVPYPFNDYAKCMVPGATLLKLIVEGQFSYVINAIGKYLLPSLEFQKVQSMKGLLQNQ